MPFAKSDSFVIALVVAGGMALFGAVSYVFIMGYVEKDPIKRGADSKAPARIYGSI